MRHRLFTNARLNYTCRTFAANLQENRHEQERKNIGGHERRYRQYRSRPDVTRTGV